MSDPGNAEAHPLAGAGRLRSIRRHLPIAEQRGRVVGATAVSLKRLRPISRHVRRRTEFNRDLPYEPDEHLKRDAELPRRRGLRGSRRLLIGPTPNPPGCVVLARSKSATPAGATPAFRMTRIAWPLAHAWLVLGRARGSGALLVSWSRLAVRVARGRARKRIRLLGRGRAGRASSGCGPRAFSRSPR